MQWGTSFTGARLACAPLCFVLAQVAEMTGRKGRVVRDARGRPVYELRAAPESSEMDSLNGALRGWAGPRALTPSPHVG